jgi:hypothetical protein
MLHHDHLSRRFAPGHESHFEIANKMRATDRALAIGTAAQSQLIEMWTRPELVMPCSQVGLLAEADHHRVCCRAVPAACKSSTFAGSGTASRAYPHPRTWRLPGGGLSYQRELTDELELMDSTDLNTEVRNNPVYVDQCGSLRQD